MKHPRREGLLTFAADSKEECDNWIQTFQLGASIQVQPVNTVEEIRIADLDMQKHWSTVGPSDTNHAMASEVECTHTYADYYYTLYLSFCTLRANELYSIKGTELCTNLHITSVTLIQRKHSGSYLPCHINFWR